MSKPRTEYTVTRVQYDLNWMNRFNQVVDGKKFKQHFNMLRRQGIPKLMAREAAEKAATVLVPKVRSHA